MDARALFLADHARIHAAATSTEAEMAAAGGFTMQDDTLKRLEEADLRASPEGLCSIVWHIWHMTRIEDVVVNAMLRGAPEVLDRDGWLDRLGVDVRLVGTGDSDQEVRGFSERVDIPALLAYRDAVGQSRPAPGSATLDLDTLDAVPGPAPSASPPPRPSSGSGRAGCCASTPARAAPSCSPSRSPITASCTGPKPASPAPASATATPDGRRPDLGFPGCGTAVRMPRPNVLVKVLRAAARFTCSGRSCWTQCPAFRSAPAAASVPMPPGRSSTRVPAPGPASPDQHGLGLTGRRSSPDRDSGVATSAR